MIFLQNLWNAALTEPLELWHEDMSKHKEDLLPTMRLRLVYTDTMNIEHSFVWECAISGNPGILSI